MHPVLLTAPALSARWNVSTHTLSQWRWNGRGPQFIKINGRVLYRVDDIETFEESRLCKSTTALRLVSSNVKWERPKEYSIKGY